MGLGHCNSNITCTYQPKPTLDFQFRLECALLIKYFYRDACITKVVMAKLKTAFRIKTIFTLLRVRSTHKDGRRMSNIPHNSFNTKLENTGRKKTKLVFLLCSSFIPVAYACVGCVFVVKF